MLPMPMIQSVGRESTEKGHTYFRWVGPTVGSQSQERIARVALLAGKGLTFILWAWKGLNFLGQEKD